MSQDEPSPEPTPEPDAQPERDGVTREQLRNAVSRYMGATLQNRMRASHDLDGLLDRLIAERDAERARAERAESEVGRLRAAAYHSPGLLFVDLWRESSAEVERLRADYVNLARLARKVFADEGHDPQRTPRRVFEDEVSSKLKAIAATRGASHE